MKKTTKYIIYLAIIIVLAGTIFILGGVWFGPRFERSQPVGIKEQSDSAQEKAPITISTRSQKLAEEEVVGAKLNLVTAIIQVAKSNIPAVVHIQVTEREEVSNPFFPFDSSPFFRHFFGLPKK